MNDNNNNTATRLGGEYAAAAVVAGGSDPFPSVVAEEDIERECLLGDVPAAGDFAALAEDLGREPTGEEREVFERAFADTMRAAIAEATARKRAALAVRRPSSMTWMSRRETEKWS